MENDEILKLKFYSNDLHKELSIGEYLITLLRTLWLDKDGFSGKRPFGTSNWENELYKALILHELIDGHLDDDGYIDYIADKKDADKLILRLINHIGRDF